MGFSLPVQPGWRTKTELQVRRASVLKLGLGQYGGCACEAAASKYDPGYKKSASSSKSKKSDKYTSVAEASSSGRQPKKASRVEKKEQVTFLQHNEC